MTPFLALATAACGFGLLGCRSSGAPTTADGGGVALRDASSRAAADAAAARDASILSRTDSGRASSSDAALRRTDSSGGRTGPLCDGGALSDAGGPPEDCVPPCVWQAIMECFPTGVCGSAQPFRKVGNPLNGIKGSFGYDVYAGTELCYHYFWGGVPPSGLNSQWEWSNAKGESIAWGLSSAGGVAGPTFCGPRCNPLNLLPSTPDASRCIEPEYSLEPSQARCASWRWVY